MDGKTATPKTKADVDCTNNINNKNTNSNDVEDTEGDKDFDAEEDDPEYSEKAEGGKRGSQIARATGVVKAGPEKPKKKPGKPKKQKTITDLGGALDAQLVQRAFRTTYTETNFAWKKMAMRWGHGKVMWASFLHEGDLYDRPQSFAEELMGKFADKFPELHESLNELQIKHITKIMATIKRTISMLDLTELMKGLPSDLADALQSMTSDIKGSSWSSKSTLNSATPSSCVYDAFSKQVAVSTTGVSIRENEQYGSLGGVSAMTTTTNQTGTGTSMRDSIDKKNKARLEALVEVQMQKMQRISYCAPLDKCNDTSDLAFDPYDLRIKNRF